MRLEAILVHGFKSLLLKETGLGAIVPDMVYLSIFALVSLMSVRLYCSRMA